MRALAVVLSLFAATPAAAAPMLVPLGTVGAAAVSNDGTVVGGSFNGVTEDAWRWTQQTGKVLLPAPLNTTMVSSTARDVSADGSVIVGQLSYTAGGSTRTEAFRWTAATGTQRLGFLPTATGNTRSSVAFGVSADGTQVVGTSSYDLRDEAFSWTQAGGLVPLNPALGETGYRRVAQTISGDGSTIAGFRITLSDNSLTAFRWTQAGGIEAIGQGGVRAASYDGAVLVGSYEPAPFTAVAFRWTEQDGFEPLGVPPGETRSVAVDVSPNGSTILLSSGWIWRERDGFTTVQSFLEGHGLDLAGWSELSASDFSHDGKVLLGSGRNASGVVENWIATIPEPATALLLGCGLLGVAAGRRARCSPRRHGWPSGCPEYPTP